ncbi:MAG: dihydropteroate synthase, partial [Betaproteobacteria bacterium]|nr:dihydropteroate synthase [Betaproteobacteria bacterium]
VLVGLSRKRLIGEITGKALADRDAGSIGGALAAYALGASILRVHDVAGTVDALRVYRRFIDRKV